jgi:hypothetical protein
MAVSKAKEHVDEIVISIEFQACHQGDVFLVPAILANTAKLSVTQREQPYRSSSNVVYSRKGKRKNVREIYKTGLLFSLYFLGARFLHPFQKNPPLQKFIHRRLMLSSVSSCITKEKPPCKYVVLCNLSGHARFPYSS